MVGLLLWLLIFGLVVWVAFYILGMLPIDARIKNIVTVVIAVIFLILLIQALFGGFALPGVRWERPL